MDRSYIGRNRASRERLRALGERFTDEQLTLSLEAGWTVGVALAHLAYWDGRVLATIETSVRHGLPRYWWEGVETDAVNAACLPRWQTIAPRDALAEALRVAEIVDRVLEELAPDALAAIVAERPWAPDRSRHRGAHLDEVERALGS